MKMGIHSSACFIFMELFLLRNVFAIVLPCSQGHLSEVCYLGQYYSTSEFPNGPNQTSINITIWFKDIVNIDEEIQSLTLFTTIGIQWEDQRLSVNQNEADIKL